MARLNFLDFSTLWVAFGFRLFQAAYFINIQQLARIIMIITRQYCIFTLPPIISSTYECAVLPLSLTGQYLYIRNFGPYHEIVYFNKTLCAGFT